jgi:hypothetical protein
MPRVAPALDLAMKSRVPCGSLGGLAADHDPDEVPSLDAGRKRGDGVFISAPPAPHTGRWNWC